MIWLYILAAIVAQGIVVVLLIEFINRKPAPEKSEEVRASPDPPPAESNAPTSPLAAPKEDGTSVIGESTFSYEAFQAMQEEIKALRECVETLMDAKDAEFDEKTEEKQEPKEAVPDARMSPEEEAKAWEDHRDEIANLDKEDESVAYPNPLASGADFDSIAKATVILETPDGRTNEDLQFAVKLYRTLEGTEFCGCLPNALLEKLYECHRKVELKENAFPEDNEEEKKAPAEEKKPMPKKQKEPKRKMPTPAKQPDENASKPKFSMDFVRKSPQNK